MARRRQRFGKLFEKLRDAQGAPPAGRVANFNDFLNGKRKITVTNKPPASKYILREAAIVPFNLKLAGAAATDSEKYLASFTEMSLSAIGTVGLTQAQLGYDSVTANTVLSSSFYPALLRVFLPSGTGTSPISAVTGEEYKRRNGTSYQYPFGQTATITEEEEARNALTLEVRGTAGNERATCSYQPEEFRSTRRRGASI